ncbi:unnamed protein product [Effrenium voratum]|nr:unnamed protein product [Effrenium voratum]
MKPALPTNCGIASCVELVDNDSLRFDAKLQVWRCRCKLTGYTWNGEPRKSWHEAWTFLGLPREKWHWDTRPPNAERVRKVQESEQKAEDKMPLAAGTGIHSAARLLQGECRGQAAVRAIFEEGASVRSKRPGCWVRAAPE